MTTTEAHVIINRPVEAVFAFCIDPSNTPKWVDSVAVEQTNEWPVKVGTVYRSQNQAGEWFQLELTDYRPTQAFTLSKQDGGQVRYVFSAPSPGTTQLDYTWTSDTELSEEFLNALLGKLKTVIETS